MAERLLTPSKITAWLDCAHFLTLKHEVEAGTRTVERSPFGEMAQMLLDKGIEHERAVLARYRLDGFTVFEVPEQNRAGGESFQQWVDRVGDVLGERHDVVFQMPFVHEGIRGIADFLHRVDDDETGTFTYEPIDAKLARKEAKPGHVLQLCFYAEAIAASTGRMPEWLHIELGSGRSEAVRVADVLPYWRRLRGQLAKLLTAGVEVDTRPKPCDHCQFCEFELVCDAAWRAADSLVHVAGVRTADRLLLQQDGVRTIAALAELDREVADLDPARRERFVRQARLQVQARNAPDEKPPFELLVDDALDGPFDASDASDASDGAPDPIGFAALPEPDDGDIFLDFEGHPFWHADAELFFLFGLIERSPAGEWDFQAYWAHTKPEEATATKVLIDHLAARRVQFPDMHVYHYNHTERSSLERLVTEHGVAELALEQLISTGLFVDLFPIVKGAMQVGVEGYGLKHVERLTDYERGHEIDRGSGAVVEYERWMGSGDEASLTKIAAYNADDVRATRALRDWLVVQRPAGVPWRAAVLGREEPAAELDARIEALHAFGPGTVEHLMGDLLGYWRRERQVVSADAYRLSIADDADQLESLSAITRLTFRGFEPQVSAKTGKPLKWPWARFTFPPQPIDVDIQRGSELIVALDEQQWLFFKLEHIDAAAGELSVTWDDAAAEAGVYPSSLVHYKWFKEGAKLTAVEDLADEMLAGRAERVGHAMLRRDLPSFVPGSGPVGGEFVGEVPAICEWVTGLGRSYVPIQGPPGTGKTFTGAHMIRTLVNAGLRVGVTAMSHAAIDNLMQAVVERFRDEGDSDNLRAVRKAKEGSVRGVRYVDDNANVARGDFNVIAGTTWLFASKPMRENPVDVLVVDEAGQLGLADTVAATISATNVILLGDPQQLPQVSQATHPGGAGASALEHLLGDELTVPADRGVLLDTTWRMHPDVCEFISEVMYGGKLHSHASCGGQSAAGQMGLRWLRSVHKGCSTESAEEAAIIVAKVEELFGQPWTDQHGVTGPLKAADFMVVAPYNDQRRCIETALRVNPATRGVEVGTVDKFQGREAAVVLFSMTTSSSEFMPRTADFLFSKNRLNVAISRARCLAYLVCTDELLDTRAKNVDEMGLISALCSFVERAGAS